MPSWNQLLTQLGQQPSDAAKAQWLAASLTTALASVSAARQGRNVIFYASAFLQKPDAPQATLSLTHEEVNGFMSVVYGMDCTKHLTLMLHSPGGVTNAAESVVAYLRSKFTHIEVIIPTYAMSAATMISLASNRLIMGRQSQLGPIDPQMPIAGRYVSARAVVEQFDRAKREIPNDLRLAHVWAPVLQSMGPALLQEAQNALDYGEKMVAGWIADRMCGTHPDPVAAGAKIARHFNDATTHKSHGRRIDRDEARSNGVAVEDLEADQSLQECVLTAYHLMSITFEVTPSSKALFSHTGSGWIKNFNLVRAAQPIP